MPDTVEQRSENSKASRYREEEYTDNQVGSEIRGGQSLGSLSFINPSHTPPHLFPALLGSSFKRSRTTSPPTSLEDNGSETDAEAFNIATPSSDLDHSLDRRDVERGDSLLSTANLALQSHSLSGAHSHPQHQQTPLRFSFGSANTARGEMGVGDEKNKETIDGLLATNMLNITDGDATSNGHAALPSYQQATGQSVDSLTASVDVEMTSNVTPSSTTPDCNEQIANVTTSNQKPLRLGESWFLVDCKWFEQWSTACSNGVASKDRGGTVVGPVQTQDLLTKRHDVLSLKVGLEEGVHFRLLSKESWEMLTTWYGRSDPPVERKVINMPSSHTLRIELYPPFLKISCIGEQITSFTIALSILSTFGELKQAARRHLSQTSDQFGAQNAEELVFRFWRLPLDQIDTPFTRVSLQASGVELISEDKEEHTTLAELQLDQPVENLALEAKKANSAWSFTQDGKSANSVKGIFKQDGGDFLSRMQSGTTKVSDLGMTSAAAAVAESSNNGGSASRVTRSQTAADRGSEKQSGLTGLYNLGNTCFMNAALQCMSNTKELKDYFVSGVYKSEINADNPLGMGGAMAKVFGELLTKLWKSKGGAWHPREFKTILSRFSPQFIGYAQQDTQELLAFLLDGLHEDLNRIVKKPYIEAPDWEGGGLQEMVAFAHKQWEIYKLRNDSVIVDLFQGQYRSTLVCPDCGKVSIKFDPFMYLTLPIPNRKTYTRKIIYLPWSKASDPIEVEMQFNGETSIGHLKKKLGEWFNANPSHMIACDVFNRTFYKVYSDFETANEIGVNDVTFVYELPGQMRPIASAPGGGSFHQRETVQELEAKTPPKAVNVEEREMAMLPVFSIAKGSKQYSNHYNRNGGSAFGQPFFVAIAQEDLDNEEAIQRAVYEKYMQYTSDKTALQGYWDGLEEGGLTANSQEDWDMLVDTTTTGASSVVLPKGDGAQHDTIAEIHDGGLVVNIVPDEASKRLGPATTIGDGTRGKVPQKRPFTLHFVVHREDQSPVTLKPDGHEDLGEEMHKRALRLTANGKGEGTVMKTDQEDDLVHVERGNGRDVGQWSLVYSGGALVCSWPDEVKDKLFGLDDDRWGGGSKRSTFVDPQLEAERNADTGGKKVKTSISIDDCLNEFTKEEQLGESDPWYCPQCKDFKQATKKFDLWKVPDILVVHLKRFSSGRIGRDKIDSLIDFPVHNFDLTDRVEGAKAVSQLHEDEEDDEKLMQSIGSLGADDDAVEADSPIYDLYAVDNHYGGLGGGHYTAFAKNPEDEKWYYFDDSSVRAVTNPEVEVKDKAAYLLFYRRRTTRPIGGKSRDKVREKVNSEGDEETAHSFQESQLNREAGAKFEEGEGSGKREGTHYQDDQARLEDEEPPMIGRYPWNFEDEVPSPRPYSPQGLLGGWDAIASNRRTRSLSSDGSVGASLGEGGDDDEDSDFELDAVSTPSPRSLHQNELGPPHEAVVAPQSESASSHPGGVHQ
ncbi:hypothetical protein CBS101457_004466 [Exobasidium rhododendri]|nr:hypothetical protein CBS101457_004466 [Exobasidium rhododendri]